MKDSRTLSEVSKDFGINEARGLRKLNAKDKNLKWRMEQRKKFHLPASFKWQFKDEETGFFLIAVVKYIDAELINNYEAEFTIEGAFELRNVGTNPSNPVSNEDTFYKKIEEFLSVALLKEFKANPKGKEIEFKATVSYDYKPGGFQSEPDWKEAEANIVVKVSDVVRKFTEEMPYIDDIAKILTQKRVLPFKAVAKKIQVQVPFLEPHEPEFEYD